MTVKERFNPLMAEDLSELNEESTIGKIKYYRKRGYSIKNLSEKFSKSIYEIENILKDKSDFYHRIGSMKWV